MRGWLFAAAIFALSALAQTFEVVSGEARYRVREELLQVGLADAVGTTKQCGGRSGSKAGGWAGSLRWT